jgi:hypothetical protein
MSTMSSSSVQPLYAHIHRLLDEHVAVHLTTDYMDYTQLRVFQVNITTSDSRAVETDFVLRLDPHR